MRCVLGLDLSASSTGVALVREDKTILHTETIIPKKLTGEPRTHFIATRICSLLAQHSPAFVVVEDYAVGKFAGSAIVNVSLGAVVRFILWQDGIPTMFVSPTALKKWLTGKGTAKKEDMVLAIYKQFGHTSATNDIADAIALAMVGGAYLGAPCTKAQGYVLDTVINANPGFVGATKGLVRSVDTMR